MWAAYPKSVRGHTNNAKRALSSRFVPPEFGATKRLIILLRICINSRKCFPRLSMRRKSGVTCMYRVTTLDVLLHARSTKTSIAWERGNCFPPHAFPTIHVLGSELCTEEVGWYCLPPETVIHCRQAWISFCFAFIEITNREYVRHVLTLLLIVLARRVGQQSTRAHVAAALHSIQAEKSIAWLH